MNTVVKRSLKWTGIMLAAVLLIVVALVLWVFNTNAGTRWAFNLASGFTDDKLTAGQIGGTIAGPLTLSQLRYADPQGGMDFSAQRIHIDVQVSALWQRMLHITNAEIGGVRVQLSEATAPPEPAPEQPAAFDLQPPLDIVLDRLVVRDVSVRNQAAEPILVSHAAAAGQWTSDGISVRQLDVNSPQGEVHFRGDVQQNEYFVGSGTGSFRWDTGTQRIAGTVNAQSRDENATINLRLTSPLRARLELALQQQNTVPWRFALEVPRFDPRENLMPDSSFQSLAASLHGEGTMAQGQVSGRLSLDDQPLILTPIRFERTDEALQLDGTMRVAESTGALRLNATVQLDQTPATTQAHLKWDDLSLPEEWVGQTLLTRGDVKFHGSAEDYAANGALAIGPADRVADIRFDVNGSPEAVQLKQLDIRQAAGELDASGSIGLQPQLSWDITASARDFDPGAFAAAWQGDLSFGVTSQGKLLEAGPEGTLKLDNLRGELRGRALTGNADLALTPEPVLAGRLAIRSGDSTLRLTGERGNEMDAVLEASIASLNDWLPDARGNVQARFTANGKWPALTIAGTANAREIEIGTTSVERLGLELEVRNPQEPEGSARIDVTNALAAGFEFASLSTQLSGTKQEHTLTLDANGEPIGADLRVVGTLEGSTWSGTLQQLALDVERAADLRLQSPAEIAYSPDGVSITELCMADGAIRLCAEGVSQTSGELQARYSLAGIPLQLANVFAPALPLALRGAISGEGDIRRTATGTLFGKATLRSPNGRVAQQVAEGDEQEVLLTYDDFELTATLAGAEANGQVRARLDQRGELAGNVMVNGLGEEASPLSGELRLNLPSLAAVSLFTPQLANVTGQVAADARFAGTVQEPQWTGQLNVTEFGADLPAIGITLKNGNVRATPQPDGEIRLAGRIESGKGFVAFDGEATPDGLVDVRVNGDEFLAADIPGARVIVEPKLSFVRTEERMALNGSVRIPTATINLQKLPRGESVQQASPDVVVIDAKEQEDEAEQAPLFAEITVVLGENIELAGFGLEASVDGQLVVREAPGQTTTASGEVRVEGQYKAYGQDLSIQRGQVLYAGTPIDNPRLNIEAVREIEDSNITAGIRITGEARNPVLTLFSDPAMGQADALAYLVTGKPLSAVGQGSGEEGDLMQTAARSLGTATGGLLAKRLGKRLGVDEVGIEDNEMIGGSAFTVGEYLSPRLYLSYGIGLFEPGEVVTLRYELSDDLAIRAQRGPEDTRAGIQYRHER